MNQSGSLGDRLNDSSLIVDQHNRRDQHVITEQAIESDEIEPTVLINRSDADRKFLLGKHARRLQHRLMLYCRNDDPLPRGIAHRNTSRHAKQRQIIGFGRSRGENDLPWRRTEDRKSVV